MAKPSNQIIISTLLLASLIALTYPTKTLSDVPCQYPCYPPPVGTTITTPATGVYGYPPPVGGVYPPPIGYYPSNNPPPYDGTGYYGGPPPPDPILPYFPFYYKKPLHGSNESSARSTLVGRPAQYLLVFLFFCFFY